MTAMEVAMALSSGSGENHSSAGTMRKPPPTPIRPESVPTPRPMASSGFWRSGPPAALGGRLLLRHRRQADHSTRAQKAATRAASGTKRPSHWPSALPGRPLSASSRAGRQATWPSRARGMAPISADMATAPRLTPMASRSGRCRLSSSGRATSEPPAPVRPRRRPSSRPMPVASTSSHSIGATSGVLGEDGANAGQHLRAVPLGVEHGLFQQAGEHFLVGLVQRLAGGGELLGDRLAVFIAANHALDATDLAFDTGQAFEHGVLVNLDGVGHGYSQRKTRTSVLLRPRAG